jgi:outer membrane protein assembly factor BamB
MADTVFVGLKGTVVAIDRTSGETRWSTELKGSDFVNVSVVDGDLYAACRGRLYRLDPDSGTIQWRNDLPVSAGGSSRLRADRRSRLAKRRGGVRPGQPRRPPHDGRRC